MKRLKFKRDSQRSKVYTAERLLHAKLEKYKKTEVITSQKELEFACAFTWEALDMAQQHMPKVRFGRMSGAHYCFAKHEVAFSRETMACSLFVCHELTHAALSGDMLAGRVAGHGPEFCRLYLKAVERSMSESVADALGYCFDAVGVRVAAQ